MGKLDILDIKEVLFSRGFNLLDAGCIDGMLYVEYCRRGESFSSSTMLVEDNSYNLMQKVLRLV